MSCQITNNATIEVVLSYLHLKGLSLPRCQALGADIMLANVDAYSHRYSEPMETPEAEYYDVMVADLPLPKVLGCASYLNYQISDHREYDWLAVSALLNKIKADLLEEIDQPNTLPHNLPGYCWGVDD